MDPESEVLVAMPPFGQMVKMLRGDPRLRLHSRAKCSGRRSPCVIHSPSDHHMKDWMMCFRFDIEVPLVERICQHGVGHPDPDSLRYFLERGDYEHLSVHGCDGCCAAPEPAELPPEEETGSTSFVTQVSWTT